jgi:hypothetical protein
MFRVCSVTTYNEKTKSITKKTAKAKNTLNSVKLNSEFATENRTQKFVD